jgi:hypothetical protein
MPPPSLCAYHLSAELVLNWVLSLKHIWPMESSIRAFSEAAAGYEGFGEGDDNP